MGNQIIKRHRDYYEELWEDTNGLVDVMNMGLPTLFEDGEKLKEKSKWIEECELMLQRILENAIGKDSTLDESCE